ncbi:unnamed protein product, partial [Amoebophrya sp. A25]
SSRSLSCFSGLLCRNARSSSPTMGRSSTPVLSVDSPTVPLSRSNSEPAVPERRSFGRAGLGSFMTRDREVNTTSPSTTENKLFKDVDHDVDINIKNTTDVIDYYDFYAIRQVRQQAEAEDARVQKAKQITREWASTRDQGSATSTSTYDLQKTTTGDDAEPRVEESSPSVVVDVDLLHEDFQLVDLDGIE